METTTERKLSPEHKDALALGRKRSKIVNDYLTVIDSDKPKRGRKRTQESINKRLAAIDAELVSSTMVKRLRLLTEAESLQKEQEKLVDNEKIKELEDQFVEVAKEFDNGRIPYPAWRALGVSTEVLDRAGITK